MQQLKPKAPKSHKKILAWLLGGVLFMFGFCYMLVPLYTLVCKQLGINGQANYRVKEDKRVDVDLNRTIRVDFATAIHGDFDFSFVPLTKHIFVHPGEKKLVYFYAQNKTGHDITTQAIPSITPDEAAKYLKKTQCFCFTQQFFFNQEKAGMPVYFYIDPKVPKAIKEITLSYTLFDSSEFVKKGQKPFTQGRINL